MVQSTATYPNITHRLDKLNILVFWEILKSNNPYLLDGDYMEHKEYTEEEEQYIRHTWEIMYDSYFQLKNDGKSKQVLQKSYDLMLMGHKIASLESIHRMLVKLHESMEQLPEDDFARHKQGYLKAILMFEQDVPVQFFESIPYNLKILEKRILALQNKYNRNKLENKKEVEEQVDNVFDVIVKVADRLNMHLDASRLSVAEWIAWEKRAKKKQEAEEAALRNKKGKK